MSTFYDLGTSEVLYESAASIQGLCITNNFITALKRDEYTRRLRGREFTQRLSVMVKLF